MVLLLVTCCLIDKNELYLNASSHRTNFSNIVIAYRWIWLSLTSEIQMRYAEIEVKFDLLRFLYVCFSFVANIYVWCCRLWSGKKWISSSMVLFCFRILMRNQSVSFAMSAHCIHYVAKPMNCASIPVWPNWAANHIYLLALSLPMCICVYVSVCLPLSYFILQCESIVNDDSRAGHTTV